MLHAKIHQRYTSVTDAFLALDVDRSGSIDAFELARILSQHGIEVSPQEMEVLLARYDTDRNGRVDVRATHSAQIPVHSVHSALRSLHWVCCRWT